jgi:integrase/recombinase XerD
MANVHNCHELVDRNIFEFCCIKIFFNYDSIVHADRNRMAGKQAKILFDHHVHALLAYAQASRYPGRNRVIVLLSVKAGLRAGEIANLTWPMVLDPSGEIATYIELHDGAAKNRGGRRVPLHNDLREALARWREVSGGPLYVVGSERGDGLTPASIVNWFTAAYRDLGLAGCSSHSGRRTFITRAARLVHKAGGSLRDVQILAGHRSIQTTQRYIDGDTDAQRRLVALI